MLYYLELKQILSLFIGFCLVLCRATCLVQFKGDPGELGDSSLDLSKYYPENKPLSRKRRIVTFAPRSLFTITNKLDVPLFSKLDGNITGKFKGRIHIRYTAPDIIVLGKRSIDSDRADIYDSLISMLDSFGINGSGCLLRSVCEMAEEPLAGYGLLGELLRMFLSPNHNLGWKAQEELHFYSEAERLGRHEGKCDQTYSTCPFSLEELVHSGITALNTPPSRAMRRRRRRANLEL